MKSIINKLSLLIVPILGIGSLTAKAEESLIEMDLRSLLEVKIKSVSRIEEPLSESIVPVTLITKSMIRESGARTLKDLLTSFVPSMLIQTTFC